MKLDRLEAVYYLAAVLLVIIYAWFAANFWLALLAGAFALALAFCIVFWFGHLIPFLNRFLDP